MPEIGRKKQLPPVTLREMEPYWDEIHEWFHSRKLLYCYATEEQKRKALAYAKRKKQEESKSKKR